MQLQIWNFDFFPTLFIVMKLDLLGGYMKNKAIFLLCAACLAMTACGKAANNEQESLTEGITTITEVTEAENSPADNSELIQNYADILYGIFKNYDAATPHTYEQYFTEADISPYYIGEPVDIDIGDHTKKSECTTVTFADIDGDGVPEMCLSRMEPREGFTNLDWVDIYEPDGTCAGTFIDGQLWVADGKIYACAYDLTYGSVTDISDNFMYVYCTLGLPTSDYDAHDIIIGSADGISDFYDYSPEELQSSTEFTDDKFEEVCTEYLGTSMSKLFADGSALPAATKPIVLADPVDYSIEDISAFLESLFEEYLEEIKDSQSSR